MLKNLKKRKKSKGFTLIELVIVLAVLAIIALIAIPNFTKVREDSKAKADARTGDVIKRVTQMSLTDQDMVISGDAAVTLIITPVKDNLPTITYKTGSAESQVKFKGEGEGTPAVAEDKSTGYVNYQNALKEVGFPQVKGQEYYEVTIDTNDTVKGEVVTGATTKTPTL